MRSFEWLSRPRPERVGAVVCDLIAQTWNRHDFQPLPSMDDVRSAAESRDWTVIEEAVRISRTLSPQEGGHPGTEDQKTYLKAWAASFALHIIRFPEGFGLLQNPSKADVLMALEKAAPAIYQHVPTSKRGLTDWWRIVDGGISQARGSGSREVWIQLRG